MAIASEPSRDTVMSMLEEHVSFREIALKMCV